MEPDEKEKLIKQDERFKEAMSKFVTGKKPATKPEPIPEPIAKPKKIIGDPILANSCKNPYWAKSLNPNQSKEHVATQAIKEVCLQKQVSYKEFISSLRSNKLQEARKEALKRIMILFPDWQPAKLGKIFYRDRNSMHKMMLAIKVIGG